MPILAHSDFVKPISKLVGWILFAAGVWTFSKGGVEGGGEVDLFFMHCFGHLQKRSVKFRIKYNLGYFFTDFIFSKPSKFIYNFKSWCNFAEQTWILPWFSLNRLLSGMVQRNEKDLMHLFCLEMFGDKWQITCNTWHKISDKSCLLKKVFCRRRKNFLVKTCKK